MISVLATPDTVWVNNFEHVWLYVPVRNRWTKAEEITPLFSGSAACLARGRDRVYIAPLAPTGAPLVVYHEQSRTFRPFRPVTAASIRAVTAVAERRPLTRDIDPRRPIRREVWVGTSGGEVLCFRERDDGRLPPRPDVRKRVGQGKVMRIHAEGPDVFVSAALFEGIWHYSRRLGTWRQYKTRAAAPSDHLLSLASSDGKLFVGTLSDGPWSYAPAERGRAETRDTGRWQNLNYELLQEGRRFLYLGDHTSIRYTSIYDILAEGGRVWMATNHGLILHDPRQTPRGFEIIPPKKGLLARLALGEDVLYCGLPDGGLRVLDMTSKSWRPLGWENNEAVRSLAARGSTLWVGTEHSLFVLEDSRGVLEAKARIPVAVSALLADGGTLWVATETGIYRCQDGCASLPELPSAPVCNATAVLCHLDVLFAANERGLWRTRPHSEDGDSETTGYDVADLVGGQPITDIAVVGQRLYLSSSGGGLLAIPLAVLSQ